MVDDDDDDEVPAARSYLLKWCDLSGSGSA
jgi:hypothetical protein